MQNPPAKQRLILIIEDDLELGKIVEEILEFEDFETEIVRDGVLAYEAVTSKMPALVMLDMHLPNASGVQILNQIRADSQLRHIKVLVMTADYSMAAIAGDTADAVFTKPFQIDQLVDIVMRLLSN